MTLETISTRSNEVELQNFARVFLVEINYVVDEVKSQLLVLFRTFEIIIDYLPRDQC